MSRRHHQMVRTHVKVGSPPSLRSLAPSLPASPPPCLPSSLGALGTPTPWEGTCTECRHAAVIPSRGRPYELHRGGVQPGTNRHSKWCKTVSAARAHGASAKSATEKKRVDLQCQCLEIVITRSSNTSPTTAFFLVAQTLPIPCRGSSSARPLLAMASKKDMRRPDLSTLPHSNPARSGLRVRLRCCCPADKLCCPSVIPYQEPAAKGDAAEFASTLSSTLPMAAIFMRNRFIGWYVRRRRRPPPPPPSPELRRRPQLGWDGRLRRRDAGPVGKSGACILIAWRIQERVTGANRPPAQGGAHLQHPELVRRERGVAEEQQHARLLFGGHGL